MWWLVESGVGMRFLGGMVGWGSLGAAPIFYCGNWKLEGVKRLASYQSRISLCATLPMFRLRYEYESLIFCI